MTCKRGCLDVVDISYFSYAPPVCPIDDDEQLLNVIGNLPKCAGIALGVDRLAMVLLGATSIDEV